jgi:hypothetical protein
VRSAGAVTPGSVPMVRGEYFETVSLGTPPQTILTPGVENSRQRGGDFAAW